MPSTMPDLSTVTGACSAAAAGSGAGGRAASAKVDGERGGGRREAAGGSAGLMRSGFGQASSKLAGEASGAAGSPDGSACGRGGTPSPVFASARSRSLREVEANSKLRRRGGSGTSGGLGASGGGGGSTRGRSRAAASFCQGGGPAAGNGGAGSIFSAPGSGEGAGVPGIPRPGSTGRTRTSDGAIDPASRRAMPFNSATTTQRPASNIPEQTPMVPEIMRVLPRLNSLTVKPNRIARRPAKTAKIPAINNANAIELTPGRAATRDTRHATIPSSGVPRQRRIIACVPKGKEIRDLFTFPSATARYFEAALELGGFAALHQEFSHNAQLLDNGTAL